MPIYHIYDRSEKSEFVGLGTASQNGHKRPLIIVTHAIIQTILKTH